jgi:hypothetical protein
MVSHFEGIVSSFFLSFPKIFSPFIHPKEAVQKGMINYFDVDDLI